METRCQLSCSGTLCLIPLSQGLSLSLELSWKPESPSDPPLHVPQPGMQLHGNSLLFLQVLAILIFHQAAVFLLFKYLLGTGPSLHSRLEHMLPLQLVRLLSMLVSEVPRRGALFPRNPLTKDRVSVLGNLCHQEERTCPMLAKTIISTVRI